MTTQAQLARDTLRRLLPHCAFCEKPINGGVAYTSHRDGFGIGPEVDLCKACGSKERPTEDEIWAKIGKCEFCLSCAEIITAEERARGYVVGSYHARCLNA